ncbi:MAG: peptidylprolyl isomerase [Actinomycetales bacterium]
MATSKRDARETKKRIAAMEARRSLRDLQSRRRRRDNIAAAAGIAAVVALAVVLQLAVFSHNPTEQQYAQAAAGLESTAPKTNSPNIPAASTAAGKTFTGTLTLNSKPVGVELDGTKAPQAAAVFKSLADSNFFAGKNCHRLTTGDTSALLQCGSLKGDGAADPTYQWGPVENTPADGTYPAGTIAVARGADTYSNGTQFFIVYKDSMLPQDTGGYTIVGKVTSGLDVVTAIAAGGVEGGGTDGKPVTPVTIDSFTLQ